SRSWPRCTRRAGCSSPTRRWCPSASVPRLRRRWPGRVSGTSMHRLSASVPRRRRRPIRPTSSGPGCPTARTSPSPCAGWRPCNDAARTLPSAAQLTGDDEMLNLVRPLADLEHLGVAVEPGHRRVEHVAETTVDLDRFRRRPRRGAAGLELRHGRLLLEGLARVAQGGGAVGEPAGGFEL